MARRPAPPAGAGSAERFDRLMESAADLARTGPAEALVGVLREADRLIAWEGERLASDPGAADRLGAARARILAVSELLEGEQRRIVRDLAELQEMAVTRARYAVPRRGTGTLDRIA